MAKMRLEIEADAVDVTVELLSRNDLSLTEFAESIISGIRYSIERFEEDEEALDGA